MIEDPLPKDSKESYFLQLSDLVAYIIYLYKVVDLGLGKLPNRFPTKIDIKKIIEWIEKLKGSFNLQASEKDPYGIVCYPQ